MLFLFVFNWFITFRQEKREINNLLPCVLWYPVLLLMLLLSGIWKIRFLDLGPGRWNDARRLWRDCYLHIEVIMCRAAARRTPGLSPRQLHKQLPQVVFLANVKLPKPLSTPPKIPSCREKLVPVFMTQYVLYDKCLGNDICHDI